MIHAFHCIFTAYGFWLPNEPRGSWSNSVRSWELARFGPATKVHTRESLANHPYDHALKKQMQDALKHHPVHFTGKQAKVIAEAFAGTPYVFHACAIMPEHVHLVLGRMKRNIRQAIGHMKSVATMALRGHGWFLDHSPWVHHGWNVYLDSPQRVRNAIAYVENNPVKEGKKKQNWKFVVPYDG